MDGAHFTKMTETVSQHSIPLEILDDLGSRFIINVPEEERKDLIRICFQIELAHWFYVDEYVKGKKGLRRLCIIIYLNFVPLYFSFSPMFLPLIYKSCQK